MATPPLPQILVLDPRPYSTAIRITLSYKNVSVHKTVVSNALSLGGGGGCAIFVIGYKPTDRLMTFIFFLSIFFSYGKECFKRTLLRYTDYPTFALNYTIEFTRGSK